MRCLRLLTILSVIRFLRCEFQNYDYFMFENFPLNEKNFRQELKFVAILHNYLEDLTFWRNSLRKYLKQSKTDKTSPISGMLKWLNFSWNMIFPIYLTFSWENQSIIVIHVNIVDYSPRVFGLDKRYCAFWKWQNLGFKMILVTYT